MSRLGDSQKQTVLALLFAWPVAVAIGWAVGRETQSDWPIPVAAMVWLAAIFLYLRRSGAQRN
ncbi:MAG: hypothetical protein QM754_05080 [Tepidisphaeraceae bacterium]